MNANSPPLQLSLNEVQTTVQKAARARGFAAQPAQDAGDAAALLCAYGHDGARAALAALAAPAPAAACAPAAPADQLGARVFSSARAILHAVSAADHLLVEDGAALLLNLDAPLLAAALLSNIALAHRVTFELHPRNEGAVTHLFPQALYTDFPLPALRANADWQLNIIAHPPAAPPAPAARAAANASDWQQLQTLALQTAVPATEQSRAANAGAGQIDND